MSPVKNAAPPVSSLILSRSLSALFLTVPVSTPTTVLNKPAFVEIAKIVVSVRCAISIASLISARLYVSGHNLHTFTKYKGYSPDVNSAGSTSNIGLGTDFYAYPVARSFTFGLKAGF